MFSFYPIRYFDIIDYPPSPGSDTPPSPSGNPLPPPQPPVYTDPSNPAPTPSPGSGYIDNAIQTAINYTGMLVGYYKIDLNSTKTNIYGESVEKWYYDVIQLPCIINRNAVSNNDVDYGVDINQTISLTVSKATFQTLGFIPEVGDVIFDRSRYYEVNNIDINFITVPGTTPTTSTGAPSSTISDGGDVPGQVITYIISAYLTRVSKLNLLPYKL